MGGSVRDGYVTLPDDLEPGTKVAMSLTMTKFQGEPATIGWELLLE